MINASLIIKNSNLERCDFSWNWFLTRVVVCLILKTKEHIFFQFSLRIDKNVIQLFNWYNFIKRYIHKPFESSLQSHLLYKRVFFNIIWKLFKWLLCIQNVGDNLRRKNKIKQKIVVWNKWNPLILLKVLELMKLKYAIDFVFIIL